jgi:predicted XRE-type DNA-binding protein
MGFPSRKEIKGVLKRLEKTEGSLALNPSLATPLEVFRWKICQQFVRYARHKNLTQKQLAERLGIDPAKMSKILHHRIDEFSTDRLITLYEKIDPKVKLSIS